MPDEYDEPDDPQEPSESSVIRELRQKAKRADDLAAENDALRKESAITKAGLDLTPAQQTALLAVHEGEFTPEALAATHATLFGGGKAEEAPQVPADEVEAQQRVQEASASPEAADAHPETLAERIGRANTEAEVRALLAEAGIVTDHD